jgi:predicted nucleic acid-binding protein
MRYLLDTNVLSELVKPTPSVKVTRWVATQSSIDLAISVLTIGELVKGVERMAASTRRTELLAWFRNDLSRQFVGRILPIDAAVSSEWGTLAARGRLAERELPVFDGLLLATARVHELTLVTRNERDCADRGIPILNPWN